MSPSNNNLDKARQAEFETMLKAKELALLKKAKNELPSSKFKKELD